jgi:glycopeptide antibiotics resistance protein
MPFAEYGEQIACVMRNCRSVGTASLFLLVNGLGNIVVFVPLGGILCAAARLHFDRQASVLISAAIGLGIGLIFEVAQLWIPGRVTATDDAILNAAGSALGAWAVSGFAERQRAGHAPEGEGFHGG